MSIQRGQNLLCILSFLQISYHLGFGQISRLQCRRTGYLQLDHENKRLDSGIISKIYAVSLISCNAACVARSGCQSINFKQYEYSAVNPNCELIGLTDGPQEWKESIGWYHYKPIPKIASRCYGIQCPSNQFCEETCDSPQGYKCSDSPSCLSSPCKNNGTCHDVDKTFSCQCPQGHEGERCELAQKCISGCTTTLCSGLGSGIIFTTTGLKGRSGMIQTYSIPTTGIYFIKALGAKGGTHRTNYGTYPGIFCGGNGALMHGEFALKAGTQLRIAVGHRGGDSVEIQAGQATTQTASSFNLSIEDNAGTGGGGGSFVYTAANVLLIAAGGGGGASAGWNGVDGSRTENGTYSVGKSEDKRGKGGSNGLPGQCCNTGNYHGGTGAGWLGQGGPRASESHGERGGSRIENWVGGRAGTMNSGNNGGPAPGAVGGFGGGGGGSEDNGASGGGGGYSGGGSGSFQNQGGGGGGSFCNETLSIANSCIGVTGGNKNHYGFVIINKIS